MAKYKVGDRVTVTFLSSTYPAEILSSKQNPLAPERLVYLVKTDHGRFIPYVGVNGSEKYANINTDEEEVLKNKSNGKKKRKNSESENREEPS